MDKIIVIGHRNPDSDSVCSAIGYAFFKNSVDRNAVYIPARAGELNSETRYILEKFQVEEPELVDTLRLKLRDLELRPPVSASPSASIKEVVDLMKENEIRLIPLVDEEGKPIGVVTQSKVAREFVEGLGRQDLSSNPVEVRLLSKVLKGKILANSSGRKTLEGSIFIGARKPETLAKSMGRKDILLVGDRFDIVKASLQVPVAAVILTGGVDLPQDLLTIAREKGVLVITTPYDTFTTAKLIELSRPAFSFMRRDYPTAFLDEYMEEVKEKVLNSKIRGVLVLDYDGRLVGVVTRTDLINLKRKKVILVDHNEASQAVDGIEEAEIIEVIDHHRIGEISTLKPIYFYVEPIGSTSTIVADFFSQRRVPMPKEIAGVLLSGIISDTMNLTLSTTTLKDKRVARRLASLLKIDIPSFARELLRAASRIEDLSPKEIIFRDFKEYRFGKKKVGIGQIITPDFSILYQREEEIRQALKETKEMGGYALIALMLTDPLRKLSEVWAVGEKGLIRQAFDVEEAQGKFILKNVLSRKKDFMTRLGETIIRGKL